MLAAEKAKLNLLRSSPNTRFTGRSNRSCEVPREPDKLAIIFFFDPSIHTLEYSSNSYCCAASAREIRLECLDSYELGSHAAEVKWNEQDQFSVKRR